MFNSAVLDVAIGLIFVYLLLAMMCTVVTEWLSGWRRWRPKELSLALKSLLGDRAQELLQHPLISGFAVEEEKQRVRNLLGKVRTVTPSYIDPQVFAAALMDLARRTPGVESTSKGHQVVAALAEQAAAQGEPPEKLIAEWYARSMDRFSGRYKRKVQGWTWLIAFAVTIVANADTIEIARRLWQNPALRAAAVAEAEVRARKEPPLNVEYPDPDSPEPTDPKILKPESGEAYTLSDKERELLEQLIGWGPDWDKMNKLRESPCPKQEAPKEQPKQKENDCKEQAAAKPGSFPQEAALLIAGHLPGWLLTALAVSLGAPFWFDFLNKFINLRNAGKKPSERKAGDESRQPAGTR